MNTTTLTERGLELVDEENLGAAYLVLQAAPPGNDHTHADPTLYMQPLEVLKVPIKERVLVVPLDFKRDRSSIKRSHMINFM